jgi:hypothetical protein
MGFCRHDLAWWVAHFAVVLTSLTSSFGIRRQACPVRATVMAVDAVTAPVRAPRRRLGPAMPKQPLGQANSAGPRAEMPAQHCAALFRVFVFF